jgi:hypothetical protein
MSSLVTVPSWTKLTLHRSLPDDSKPLIIPTDLNIPRRPKKAHETDGEVAATNGVSGGTAEVSTKRKRGPDEAELEDLQIRKRGKVPETNGNSSGAKDHDIIVLEDDGAIVLDD